MEASWYRWHPRIVRVQELPAAGRLGRVTAATAGFRDAGFPAGDYRLDPRYGGREWLTVTGTDGALGVGEAAYTAGRGDRTTLQVTDRSGT
ncbi:MAG: hypothetical protein JWM67_1979, partial [Mycobacterium sp.]|nr:hypothetical protein [Mycobacterium sp.]